MTAFDEMVLVVKPVQKKRPPLIRESGGSLFEQKNWHSRSGRRSIDWDGRLTGRGRSGVGVPYEPFAFGPGYRLSGRLSRL